MLDSRITQTVLVVAAHPDDEVLGCGGTLTRHAAAGDSVHVLILAEGATARDRERNKVKHNDEIADLREAAQKAAHIVGAHPPRFAELPDNRMDSMDVLDIIKTVEAIVNELRPRTVYTHHGGDLNVDHRLTHEAVVTACRPLPNSSVAAIYSFETPSSTEWASTERSTAFVPTRYVDITSNLETKLRALSCYETELREFPHPRSTEGVTSLARYRGASVGVSAAEAFQVVRERV